MSIKLSSKPYNIWDSEKANKYEKQWKSDKCLDKCYATTILWVSNKLRMKKRNKGQRKAKCDDFSCGKRQNNAELHLERGDFSIHYDEGHRLVDGDSESHTICCSFCCFYHLDRQLDSGLTQKRRKPDTTHAHLGYRVKKESTMWV